MSHEQRSPRSLSRRSFFAQAGLLGATGALAACSQRVPRFIVPYLVPADDVVPGVPVGYRSICRGCPASCGLTAQVMNGRAIKLEGNPEHPASAGALCLVGQAAIEELYAPERLTGPLAPPAGGAPHAVPIDWTEANRRFADGLRQAIDHGREVVVLTRPESGALRELMGQWLTALGQPAGNVVVFDPAEPIWLREAARFTFGIDAQPLWILEAARTVLSIGADLVEDYGSPVEYGRALAAIRANRQRRFVYAGSRLSLTAASATGRIAIQPGHEMGFVLALLGAVLTHTGSSGMLPAGARTRLIQLLQEEPHATAAQNCGVPSSRVRDLARALTDAGPGLVVGPGRVAAGEDATALAQAVAVLNLAIGAMGRTVQFAEPAAPALSAADLVQHADAGRVGALVIHHADPVGLGPVYDALGHALAKIPFVAAIGCRLDETARRAHLVLADHHPLESWGDATVQTGVHGFQQPVMTPLHNTRAAADVLIDAAGQLGRTGGLPSGTFAELMQDRLDRNRLAHGGEFAEATPPAASPDIADGALDQLAAWRPPVGTGQVPILLATPSLRHPGGIRSASPLVQEVPDALTSVAWSGWAELHPNLARARSLETGDEIELVTAAGRTRLPVFVTPGIHETAVAVPLPDATALLGPAGSLRGRVGPVTFRATGRRLTLPQIGHSLDQQGRHLAHEVPDDAELPARAAPKPTGRRRWAIAVDLDRCDGCGACVAACYVENNCAVVGPEEIARGRDMAWIRIQRFYTGSPDEPRVVFLPVMCQQCTDAPCEPVCPAYATYHTDEGLNAQIYNRCIGTRFCSNNCAYSARRFNWFDWPRPTPANLGLNPAVTVRSRGVMEKCTFCVQRIRRAEERAKLEKRQVREGEVVPACAQTCAAQALIFGDLDDPRSRISELARSGRAYRLLEELNTEPGVVYLARHEERV
jgi:Fe-S-cluster-containing dehydrogenase component/anaerobic selenocysteine-containing dehydrogenase